MKVFIVGKPTAADPTIPVGFVPGCLLTNMVVKEVIEVNAGHQVVPIVEDDQGEGWMTPLDNHDIKGMSRADRKRQQREFRRRAASHFQRIRR